MIIGVSLETVGGVYIGIWGGLGGFPSLNLNGMLPVLSRLFIPVSLYRSSAAFRSSGFAELRI